MELPSSEAEKPPKPNQSSQYGHSRIVGICLWDMEWKENANNQSCYQSKYGNHNNHLNPE